MGDATDHATTIAWSLDPAELADRRAAWKALAQVEPKELRPTLDGVQLVYASSQEVERALHQLARLERECCSFARWRVSQRGDELVLDVTSEGEGVSVVHALFDVAD